LPTVEATVEVNRTVFMPQRRIRVNVTCEGTLLVLTGAGAIVQVPRAPRQSQTTLAIEESEGTRYLAARVVSAVPHITGPERTEYRVALEFLR
jgi:hypothetical protein